MTFQVSAETFVPLEDIDRLCAIKYEETRIKAPVEEPSRKRPKTNSEETTLSPLANGKTSPWTISMSVNNNHPIITLKNLDKFQKPIAGVRSFLQELILFMQILNSACNFTTCPVLQLDGVKRQENDAFIHC